MSNKDNLGDKLFTDLLVDVSDKVFPPLVCRSPLSQEEFLSTSDQVFEAMYEHLQIQDGEKGEKPRRELEVAYKSMVSLCNPLLEISDRERFELGGRVFQALRRILNSVGANKEQRERAAGFVRRELKLNIPR